jgi:hypothetical protein
MCFHADLASCCGIKYLFTATFRRTASRASPVVDSASGNVFVFEQRPLMSLTRDGKLSGAVAGRGVRHGRRTAGGVLAVIDGDQLIVSGLMFSRGRMRRRAPVSPSTK